MSPGFYRKRLQGRGEGLIKYAFGKGGYNCHKGWRLFSRDGCFAHYSLVLRKGEGDVIDISFSLRSGNPIAQRGEEKVR